MRLHVIMHAEPENEGSIKDWALSRDVTVSRTRLYLGEPLPVLDRFDFLCVMGGPMNIYEENQYPFLAPEKRLLRSCMDEGKKILGICLGAQLLADVLGAEVTRNPERELGWLPVLLTPEGRRNIFFRDFPETFVPFHWHADTFALPKSCLHIASSEGCANQAFVREKTVVGLQFHLEVTENYLRQPGLFSVSDLVPGKFVHSPAQITDPAVMEPSARDSSRLLFLLCDRLTGLYP